MFQQAMYAGVAGNAEQVQRTVVLQREIDGGIQLLVGKEFAVANLLGDLHRFLIDNSSGPDVLVSHFTVAHRPFGQADIEAAGVNQRVGILRHQPIGHRMLGQEDRVGPVPLRMRILTPSVADDDYYWTLFDCYRHGNRSYAPLAASQASNYTWFFCNPCLAGPSIFQGLFQNVGAAMSRNICVAALPLLVCLTAVAADPPRYKLNVGQELTYQITGTSWSTNDASSAQNKQAETMPRIFWIASANPEGGWHIVEESRSQNGSGDRPQLASFDMLPDGQVRMDTMGRMMLDPSG